MIYKNRAIISWSSLLRVLLALAIFLVGCATSTSKTISPPETKAGDRFVTFWNVWAEDEQDPRFEPVTSLKPNTSYRISIDLAALQYRAAGALAIPTSLTFKSEIEKWLKPGMPDPVLKVMLLVEAAKFDASPTAKDFKVDLTRLRKVWKSGSVQTDGDHFEILRKDFDTGNESDFKFGGIYFDVKTKNIEGRASIAFSIWYKQRPIDEVSVPFCIATSPEVEKQKCGDLKQRTHPQGLLSVRLATESSEAPVAALHFVALSENDPVIGVLRVNTWAQDDFLVWEFKQKATDFSKAISEQYVQDIAAGDTDENLLFRGETFFDYLFPTGARSYDNRKVREEFLKFLSPYLLKDTSAKDYLPYSLFVRMIQVSPSPSLPIPLGLLAVRVDKDKPMTIDNGRFLGKFFVIESPLEIQSYEPASECLSRWVMVLPPEDTGDGAINDARNQLASRIKQWEKEAASLERMTPFMEWLDPTSNAQTEDPPTVLLTLSHHDRNSLYFYEKTSGKDNPLRPSKINRTFAQPSIAIINGCGTGGEGALDLISRFNERGFSTIIATSTQIEGLMAGAFLNLFSEKIAQSDGGKGEPIGLLYWKTIRALSASKPTGIINAKEFGAKALKFTLLGNGRVVLCTPKKENRPLINQ